MQRHSSLPVTHIQSVAAYSSRYQPHLAVLIIRTEGRLAHRICQYAIAVVASRNSEQEQHCHWPVLEMSMLVNAFTRIVISAVQVHEHLNSRSCKYEKDQKEQQGDGCNLAHRLQHSIEQRLESLSRLDQLHDTSDTEDPQHTNERRIDCIRFVDVIKEDTDKRNKHNERIELVPRVTEVPAVYISCCSLGCGCTHRTGKHAIILITNSPKKMNEKVLFKISRICSQAPELQQQ